METFKYACKTIGLFLEQNGFQKTDECAYSNGRCEVRIINDGYQVSSENGVVYSEGHNIYWLIGYLTYTGLMSKDYKNP